MIEISQHITYSEAIHSNKAIELGISNIPSEEQLKNIRLWAKHIFEPLREGLGNKRITIDSLFRSVELNSKTKGASTTSQHCAIKGAAGDLKGVFSTNKQLFEYIKNNLQFDQLIWEYGNDENPDWIHVSYNQGKNRNQILKTIIENKETKYVPFK